MFPKILMKITDLRSISVKGETHTRSHTHTYMVIIYMGGANGEEDFCFRLHSGYVSNRVERVIRFSGDIPVLSMSVQSASGSPSGHMTQLGVQSLSHHRCCSEVKMVIQELMSTNDVTPSYLEAVGVVPAVTHSFFPPPSHRSGASDHPEDGDTWFHASAHPGDAGELRGTGGAWSWGGKGEGRRSQRGGGNRARKLPPESVPKIDSLPQPEPGALHPLISAPLHLKFHAQHGVVLQKLILKKKKNPSTL